MRMKLKENQVQPTVDDIVLMAVSLPQLERDKLAAHMLICGDQFFHGSKQIHYANGIPKKIVDTTTKDL